MSNDIVSMFGKRTLTVREGSMFIVNMELSRVVMMGRGEVAPRGKLR